MKQLLDRLYSETFDIERFKRNDPCGVVYQLMDTLGWDIASAEEKRTMQLDIELGALFVAMISWGSRKVICPTALRMIRDEMHWHPADFIRSGAYHTSYANAKNQCVYRTLNVPTFVEVCDNIHEAIKGVDTLEQLFDGKSTRQVISTICQWLAPAKIGTMDKSACKRICMYTRWMTRHDTPDLGIWTTRSQQDLYAVMDVHVMRQTQAILTNKRPTWKACEELTSIFKSWDSQDPLRYDIALMTMADHQLEAMHND